MKSLLKLPLIVAVIIVVGRVVVERIGILPQFHNYFSAVALTVLIGPLYFGWKIAGDRMPRPYVTQFKTTVLYVVLVRAMLLPVYWLAFFYKWPEQRFLIPSEAGDGPLAGYVIVPFATAISWILASTLVGGGLGSLIIAIRRRVSAT